MTLLPDLPVRYTLLRHLASWEGATWRGLAPEADGVLALARVPNAVDGQAVVEAAASYDVGPSGLAVAAHEDVLLSDTDGHALVRVMGGCGDRFVLGNGAGNAPGRFDKPRGMVVVGGTLYVADSGNGRIQVFRLPGLELRDVWEGVLREPVAMAADGRGRIYVADRGLKEVLRFSAAGIPDQAYNLSLAQLALAAPMAVAVDDAGQLYISDVTLNRVVRFDADGQLLTDLPATGGPAKPRALVARGDRLYVADADGGRIWVYHQSQGWLGTLPGYRGSVSALAFDEQGRLYVKPGLDARYYVLEADRACVASGILDAGPFDAGDQSVWERVDVQLEAPPDSAAELRFFLADSPASGPSAADWASSDTLAPAFDTLVPVPVPGKAAAAGRRYLWLRLQLRSDDGHTSPRVFQVQAATTGESYLDHLPPVYARDDGPTRFLARLLALFRAELGDWDRALDEMPRRFDPDVADDAALPGLAGWLGFELPRRLAPADWRRLIPRISRLYDRRGTPFGIRELCELYTGARPHLAEAFVERHVWQLGESSYLGFDTALPWAAPGGLVVPGFIRTDPAFAGLLGDYYAGIAFDQLLSTRIDHTVDFTWATGGLPDGVPPTAFSVRWTGQIRPRYGEIYTFSTVAEDGVRLWIDGRLIIDTWSPSAPTEQSGRITLEAERWYAITLEYFAKERLRKELVPRPPFNLPNLREEQIVGTAKVSLSWSSRSQIKEIVPQERLYGLIDESAQAGGAQAADPCLMVGQAVIGESGPLAAADYGLPLFEDDAHLFTVLVPAAKLRTQRERALLKDVVDAEKPAHTDYHLCFVEPRMRVGFQARVGIDSIVAGPPPPMALAGTVLGKDSYLGDDDDSDAGRLGKRARVGRDAIVG
jgi:phage tail-like protein